MDSTPFSQKTNQIESEHQIVEHILEIFHSEVTQLQLFDQFWVILRIYFEYFLTKMKEE